MWTHAAFAIVSDSAHAVYTFTLLSSGYTMKLLPPLAPSKRGTVRSRLPPVAASPTVHSTLDSYATA